MYAARIRVDCCAVFSSATAGCKPFDHLLHCSKGKLSSAGARSARILGCIVFDHGSVSRMAVSYERILLHR